MKESEIERIFAKGCKEKGWLCLKFVSPSMMGLPDRIILMPNGRIFFAELKAPGKRPRALQTAVHNRLRKLGFHVCVIDSKEAAKAYISIFNLMGGEKNEVCTP